VYLNEGAKSGQKSIEKYLNVSVYDNKDLSNQALAARKVFCDYLRELDKEIQATDEEIITISRLKKALATVAETDTAKTKELFVMNSDQETLVSNPLATARIWDEAEWQLSENASKKSRRYLSAISSLMVTSWQRWRCRQ